MKIVVFASGRGSNFKAIVENIESGALTNVEVSLLLSDKPEAKVLDYAKEKGIAHVCVDASTFANRSDYEKAVLAEVQKVPCNLVVLAGYMKILGEEFLTNVGCPVVNIHPALLPSFPGLHAQRQAVEYGVKVSGCTVHFVDAELDHGPIIAQVPVPVMDDDDEESLSARILVQEHQIYSVCLQLIADNKITLENRCVKIKK
ncbi:MAG: phosphoribosylglycinamide formyltransferase [Peptococcaceae bacterium]|nr:phosphoribosylglycinamide formyltransferase [Peptococcaceae bacterium]